MRKEREIQKLSLKQTIKESVRCVYSWFFPRKPFSSKVRRELMAGVIQLSKTSYITSYLRRINR